VKIPVSVVVDVDPDEYRYDYGQDFTLDEIREDIRLRIIDGANWEMRHHRDSWFNGAKLRGEK
jgi:hypothetical protein